MRLYVPEIGDKLRLTTDWSFTLYNEHRNYDLWQVLECDKHPAMKKINDRVAELHAEIAALKKTMVDKVEPVPTWMGRNRGETRIVKVFPDQAAIDRNNTLYSELRSIERGAVPVTLPATTVLTVDRIYIRKGMTEFSSLSFYIGDCPLHALTPVKKGGGFKKGRRRFWAKLADANTIDFEPVTDE
jgi:hypothetical protein